MSGFSAARPLRCRSPFAGVSGSSPYARRGYIDHQTLSFDAYVKFIEDDFLSDVRIEPATDGRPDPRPTVRENVKIALLVTSLIAQNY